MKQLFEKIEIHSEADLPKVQTRYFCHHKKAGRIEAQEYFLDYDKDYWMGHIDWYLLPIESLESSKVERVERKSAEEILIKDKILEEYKKGNIVVAGFEGLQTMPLEEIIKQPTDGLLYDLNRNESVILTFIEDPKWVNDYAITQVVRKLKSIIDQASQSQVTDEEIEI